MENKSQLSAETTKADSKDRHITAFSAIQREYGLQIKVSGCVTLHPAQNHSEKVIGVVELDDQVVPILDTREKPFGDITDLCCIALFENQINSIKIVTGRLYESAGQVFDLIVECMDDPSTEDHLYSPSEHTAKG